jgi:hypothetical protein
MLSNQNARWPTIFVTLLFQGFSFKLPYEPLDQTGTIDALSFSWFAFGGLGG